MSIFRDIKEEAWKVSQESPPSLCEVFTRNTMVPPFLNLGSTTYLSMDKLLKLPES